MAWCYIWKYSIVRVRKGLLDLAKWLSGDTIRLGGDIIRLIRLGDNIIRLTRLSNNAIRLIRLGDNTIRFVRLGGNIIRLSVKHWENLGCLITIKRL